jgi:Bacterial Ig-like domain (group 3)
MGPGGPNANAHTLAEHWNGTAWSIVSTPSTGFGFRSVSCVSSSDCWAVGSATGEMLADHWNGTIWSNVTTPSASPIIGGVSCVSSSDCWAVGYGGNGAAAQTFAEHWNGSAWSIVATPNTSPSQNNEFNAVACTSSSDCWAVGQIDSTPTFGTLAAHWNGTAWSIVTTPNGVNSASENDLASVSCFDSSDCWAVGAQSPDNQAFMTLALHWNGTAWSVVTTPNPISTQISSLIGVVCVNSSDCWAVGGDGSRPPFQTLIEQWNGETWSIVPTPSPVQGGGLAGVVCVDTFDCWAVGGAGGGQGGAVPQTLAEHGTLTRSPTSTAFSSTPAVEGQTTTLTATVKPASGGGTPTGSVEFIDWTAGSLLGSVALSGGAASLSTVFPEEGSHLVSAVYNGDSNFLPSNATQTITVTDASLSGQSPPAPLQGGEGVPFFARAVPVSGVVASFTDADLGGTASDYAATIDWGDGTSSAGAVGTLRSGFTVSGSHTYREDRNYPVIVHIADVGGSTTSVDSSAHVSEPTNFFAFLVDLFFERFGF